MAIINSTWKRIRSGTVIHDPGSRHTGLIDEASTLVIWRMVREFGGEGVNMFETGESLRVVPWMKGGKKVAERFSTRQIEVEAQAGK
jgi:hypothetical protein